MNKTSNASRNQQKLAFAKGAGPLVVRPRRKSKRSIEIPFKDQVTDAEARQLKVAMRKFEGTTPQEREIIRKITMQARRKIYESSPASGAAPHAATPPPQESGAVRSAQVTAVKVAAAPP